MLTRTYHGGPEVKVQKESIGFTPRAYRENPMSSDTAVYFRRWVGDISSMPASGQLQRWRDSLGNAAMPREDFNGKPVRAALAREALVAPGRKRGA